MKETTKNMLRNHAISDQIHNNAKVSTSAEVSGYGVWIAICDQVPSKNQPVLAIDCNGDMAVAEHSNGIFYAVAFGYNAYENNGSWENSADRIAERVTHWMPLPVAP